MLLKACVKHCKSDSKLYAKVAGLIKVQEETK